MIACNCVERVNVKLAECNTRITVPIVFGCDQAPRVLIETHQIETGRGKPKSAAMFATFCPFCGVNYDGGKSA